MPRLERSGIGIHYDVTAPQAAAPGAPVVVFLHNIFCDRRVFAHAIETIGRRYRTIAVDFRGHGASETPARPYAVADLVADVLAVALAHPERVERLVLMGADAERDPPWPAFRNALLWRLVLLIGLRGFLVREAAKSLFGASFRREAGPGLAGWFDRILGLGARAASFALRCWAARPIRLAALPALRPPLLVVVGEEDVSCLPACGEKIQRMVPNAALARIPRAGHTMTAERPEPTTAAITQFLHAGTAGATTR